jgi:hypothetical protein
MEKLLVDVMLLAVMAGSIYGRRRVAIGGIPRWRKEVVGASGAIFSTAT